MQKINSIIKKTLQKARASKRKRAIYCFHKPTDTLQRMINACLFETYAAPHKHENPDKIEIFFILKGRAAVIAYSDAGRILSSTVLDENTQTKFIEIPPKTWHSIVVLSQEAVLYEIIDGKYNPKTHKQFAEWAPKESAEDAAKKYLDWIRKKIKHN